MDIPAAINFNKAALLRIVEELADDIVAVHGNVRAAVGEHGPHPLAMMVVGHEPGLDAIDHQSGLGGVEAGVLVDKALVDRAGERDDPRRAVVGELPGGRSMRLRPVAVAMVCDAGVIVAPAFVLIPTFGLTATSGSLAARRLSTQCNRRQ